MTISKTLPPLSQVQRQGPRAERTRNLRQEPPSLLPPERRAPLDIVGGGGEEKEEVEEEEDLLRRRVEGGDWHRGNKLPDGEVDQLRLFRRWQRVFDHLGKILNKQKS